MNIFYLTYNDAPSGVYKSQVIDVVKLYRENNFNVQLIALISIRGFLKNRQQIKKYLPDAIVLPFFPKVKNWKINKWLLKLIIKEKNSKIIARGIVATNLCLEVKEKFSEIIYDGRGAIAAEWEEYGVHDSLIVGKDTIEALEKKAINESDFRIAVSKKLIEYWEDRYDYTAGNEVIIPCSLGKSHHSNKNIVKDFSILPGLKEEDILLIYSGSIAGWQSFEILSSVLDKFLISNDKVKILFLAKEHIEIDKIIDKYPGRIYRKWVDYSEVDDYLILGDYGLLIRESNVTNRVASPVKFAEYLMAGLNVIITPELGDYSEFVGENQCGFIIYPEINALLNKVLQNQKERNQALAEKFFSKSSMSIINLYKGLL